MAAREVIHFPLWAQLPTHPVFPARLLPEPVAEPPPQYTNSRARVFLVALLTAWSPFRPPGYCCASTTVRERTSSLQIVRPFQRPLAALDEEAGLNPDRGVGERNREH